MTKNVMDTFVHIRHLPLNGNKINFHIYQMFHPFSAICTLLSWPASHFCVNRYIISSLFENKCKRHKNNRLLIWYSSRVDFPSSGKWTLLSTLKKLCPVKLQQRPKKLGYCTPLVYTMLLTILFSANLANHPKQYFYTT